MKESEKFIIRLLSAIDDLNDRAIILQSFIATEGPLSEEAAIKIRQLLKSVRA